MAAKITLEARRERRDAMRAMVYSSACPSDQMVTWTPPSVSLLSIAEIERLPTPTERLTASGIYFLWRGDDLIYIGSSENVHQRITGHINTGESEFTAATFLAVPSPWHLALEALYIRKFRPRLNKQFVGRS